MKNPSETAEHLNELVRKSGREYITLTWERFYEVCERERLKQPFIDQVQETASGQFQLIVAYGHNAIIVCHDRNFAQAEGI